MWFYTGEFSNGSEGNITANYDFFIDWGDGSKIEHYDNSMATTVYASKGGMYSSRYYIPVKHTYATKGVYKITLTGDCDNLHGYDGNVNNGAKMSSALVHSLWGVQLTKDSTSPLKYGYGSFFGCENLKFIGYGVFHNITNCREVPHLYDGAILSRIEPWMLYGGVNLESLAYTFENCQMLSIDPKVFEMCSKVTNAEHCFHRCDSLLKIPDGLFDYMPELSNVSVCFKSCSHLTYVPQTLFDKCKKIKNARQCFCGGGVSGDNSYPSIMKITSSLPPLWNRNDDIDGSRYAHGCTKSINY